MTQAAPAFAQLLDEFFLRPDEAPLEGLALPDPGATTQPAAPDPLREYLAFDLGRECYGVPIALVREIVRVPPITEVPRAPTDLLGVMNLRGEVLPVYDLKVRLRLAPAPPRIAGPDAAPALLQRSSRVVVMRGGTAGDVGVLVDAVSEVVRLRDGQIEPPPSGTAERDCIAGLGRRGDDLCILLDLERALG